MPDEELGKSIKFVFYFIFGLVLFIFGLNLAFYVLVNYWQLILLALLTILSFIGSVIFSVKRYSPSQTNTQQEPIANPEAKLLSESASTVVIQQNTLEQDCNDEELLFNAVQQKLNLAELFVEGSEPYQQTELYKKSVESIKRGGEDLYLIPMLIEKMVSKYPSKNWKIYYEFGTYFASTYARYSHPFHFKYAVEWLHFGIVCAVAKDSSIPLIPQERELVIKILLVYVAEQSEEIADRLYKGLLSQAYFLSKMPEDFRQLMKE